MENYIFYLVLNSLIYGKQTYAKDDVFAERKDVDLSSLVADGIIVAVDSYLAKIEADSAAQIAEIEAKTKAKTEAVTALIAKVTEKRVAEENRIRAEQEAEKARREAESAKFAADVAEHLKTEISRPTDDKHV